MTARETPEERARKTRERFRIVQEEEAAPIPDADDPHLTDLGNAKKLVARHGHDLRYCQARGTWYAWDGRRWKLDECGEVERRAKETVLSWYGDAAELPAKKERTKLVNHAMKCEAASRLKAMIDLAKSEPGVPVAMADLDRDPWLLNVLNGTLDVRSGELRPHDQADLITRLVPVDYDPLAGCPTFLAYLHHILQGKTELVTFLQRAIGYSLSGDTSERCLFILWGGGKNGKSTLLDTMLDLLTDYATRTNTDALMASKYERIPNDIAALKGVRFVYASEGEQGRRLAEARIKDLTGGDTVSARFMRGEWFAFRPELKLWLGTNHKPVIRGTDDAIWDRIRLVPFEVRIPPQEQDKRLRGKLLAEAPGILAWAVEGCLAWQRDGLGEPEDVLQATADYRSTEDVIGRFLGERCEFYETANVTKKALYGAYKSWCEDGGERYVTQKAFGMRLSEMGFDEAYVGNSKDRARVWIGIALLPDEESTQREGWGQSERM